jgi:predicted ATPase
MVTFTERNTLPPVGLATRQETVYSETTDDYSTVFEIATGIVVEDSTEEGACFRWYDATGTFDEVLAEVERELS